MKEKKEIKYSMGKFAFNNSGRRHTDIIIEFVRNMGCNKYLELGVWYGENITRVSNYCNYCLGVDMTDNRQFRNYKFLEMKVDDFFKQNTETFDVIFIDADHSFESVKKDFINSLNILNEYGLIFLHDTDPMNEELLNPHFCGDSYKMPKWIDENYPDLNVITFPIIESGLTIVNRKSDRRIKNLQYD